MYCMSKTIVKWTGETATAHPLRCRCWTCVNCAPYRQKLLQQEALAGKPCTFITLTSNPAVGENRDQRAQMLVDAWRKIVRKYCRINKIKRVEFIAVFEKTKRGEPHLHILARMPFMSQKWLSNQMGTLTGAPIVDIRRIDSKGKAVNYVTKYIGKDPKRFEGCKRYWRSMHYMHPTRSELRAQRRPDTIFSQVDLTFAKYRKLLQSSGYTLLKDWPSTAEIRLTQECRAPPGCRYPFGISPSVFA